MDISVIIVNYNVREFLSNALTSLYTSLEGFQSEIFVVDNASDDGSVEMVSKNFPHVRLIANKTNVGFAKANNQALVQSKGKYILLINPDTLVQENTVRELIKFFETHDNAGMTGCKILNPDGTLQLACRRSFPTPWTAFTKTFGLSALFPTSKLFARYNLTYLDPDQAYEVDAISGSFMMVKREVVEKIGGLDETFFMYGEDLDWCYRVQHSGWKVYYVPTTSIIHYKGESTKRSDIDELKVFYNAMRLFVRKHHTGSPFFEWFIYSGIYMRKFIADIARFARPLSVAALDMLIVVATLLVGEYVRKSDLFTLPQYAYPWVFIFPALIVSTALLLNGVYAEHKLSISRSFASVFSAFVVIAAIVAFEKDFAFSRMIMLISAGLSLITIPGWRLALRLMGFGENSSRATLFGRRTLIVGIEQPGQDVLKKLRARAGGGYSVVGFIDITRKRIGERIANTEILGSIETMGKVIEEYRISDVIFSSNAVSYSSILNIIANNKNRFVNFRLVPNNIEVIIGKASIDQLDDIPFIDIDYNIGKIGNRVIKRVFDIAASLCFLICIAPFVYFTRILFRLQPKGIVRTTLQMPSVLMGRVSIVGYYTNGAIPQKNIYHGKPGITGLIHIQANKNLTQDEIEQFDLYYAKNQSFMLDLEIIVKSLQQWMQR
ncbi:MAG: glycosyltransferase [Ignavibacteriales bacterium]|nr:glycosyltransferase [Ignavibacteriales bacterium]